MINIINNNNVNPLWWVCLFVDNGALCWSRTELTWRHCNCIASGRRIPQRTTDELHQQHVTSLYAKVYGFGHKLRKLAGTDVELLGLAWRFNTASPPCLTAAVTACLFTYFLTCVHSQTLFNCRFNSGLLLWACRVYRDMIIHIWIRKWVNNMTEAFSKYTVSLHTTHPRGILL